MAGTAIVPSYPHNQALKWGWWIALLVVAILLMVVFDGLAAMQGTSLLTIIKGLFQGALL